MSRVDAAAPDRLPWLQDEPQPKPAKRRGSKVLPLAAAALVLVAGGGVWLGSRTIEDRSLVPVRRAQPSATIPLPAPRPAEPVVQAPAQPVVTPAPVREVRPAPAREVPIPAPPKVTPQKRVTSELEAGQTETAPAAAPLAPVAASQPVPPKPWNPRVFGGAAGRIVQIGAFGSIYQAKQGWWYMARAYPAMRRLPAVVRPTRNSHGRVFYRFQIGTTSQAHSEILCQRMERIRFSCAVVGLPWKAKVER